MSIKLLILETHNKGGSVSGVDYARLILPGKELAKLPDFKVEMRSTPFTDEEKDWESIAKNWDIIWSGYVDEPIGYIQMKVSMMRYGKTVVIDLDDNLWEIPKGNPVRRHFIPGEIALDTASKVLEDVDYITTTNQFLKYKLVEYTAKPHNLIKVLPNYIDLSAYDYTKLTKKSRKELVILHTGSTTHQLDMLQHSFSNAIKLVVSKYPSVVYRTIGGSFLPSLKTKLMRNYETGQGLPNLYDWQSIGWVREMSEADIVVAPLLVSDFTKCKSGIKFLEYSAAKRPGVYQNIRQYKELVNGNGFLAETESDWVEAFSKLIESPELRQSMGEKAYQTAIEHQIGRNIELHADFFRGIYAKQQRS